MQVSQYEAAGVDGLQQSARTAAGQVLLVFAASVFVAMCAHVSLPLLFTPVPLTLGNFAVLLVGLLLGPRLGFLAMLAYLGEGALGMPVFNPGLLGGVAQLFGPTGGYLLAYPFAAALAGWFARKRGSAQRRFVFAFLGCLLATTLVMASGCSWLAHLGHLPVRTALVAGLLPFVPGELLKVTVAAGLFQTLTRRGAAQR